MTTASGMSTRGAAPSGGALPEETIVFPSADDERPQQSPAPPAGEAAPHADLVAPYLTHLDTNQARARWQLIQAEFVDDPRQSVAEAHALVSNLVQHIVSSFTEERNALERQWSEGETVSTEELRVCLQRYREFFTRLLPVTPDVRG